MTKIEIAHNTLQEIGKDIHYLIIYKDPQYKMLWKKHKHDLCHAYNHIATAIHCLDNILEEQEDESDTR